MVVVLGFREAGGSTGVEEGFLAGVPSVRVGVVNENWPIGAVIIAVLVKVVSNLRKKGSTFS